MELNDGTAPCLSKKDIEAALRKLHGHGRGGGYGDGGGDGVGGAHDSTAGRLLLFFHYRPTFWWLHLHVVHLDGFELPEAVSE